MPDVGKLWSMRRDGPGLGSTQIVLAGAARLLYPVMKEAPSLFDVPVAELLDAVHLIVPPSRVLLGHGVLAAGSRRARAGAEAEQRHGRTMRVEANAPVRVQVA